MSERPERAASDTVTWPGWGPSGSIPWGKALWGTEIDFGVGAKLVIDREGTGRFTDAAGETGRWDPDLLGWVDEDTGEVKDSTFGVPATEVWSGTTTGDD